LRGGAVLAVTFVSDHRQCFRCVALRLRRRRRALALSAPGIAALLYLAIPGQALGQWFWQEEWPSGARWTHLYLEPLATVTLAVPLLGEPFSAMALVGGGLVLAGVYVGQSGLTRRRSNPVPG
jgi:drug/metabolite transporter (DMT)-like permease